MMTTGGSRTLVTTAVASTIATVSCWSGGRLGFNLTPIERTEVEVGMLRGAVWHYRASQSRLPADLRELCGQEVCPATMLDGIPVDAWGTPFRYQSAPGDQYVVGSAGPDQQFDTADDVEFSSARELEQVTAIAGCYRVNFRWEDHFDRDVLELSPEPLWVMTYHLLPEIIHGSQGWWSLRGDTVLVEWGGGEHVSVLRLHRDGSDLEGRIAANVRGPERVVFTRVACLGA